MDIEGFFRELGQKAKDAVSSKPSEFVPATPIGVEELAYIIQHRLQDRYFTDEEWEQYPENIKRHFKRKK